MEKIMFDASIHLGQFSFDQRIRVACKNSQAAISSKPKIGLVGVVTSEENSWVDHIIWGLNRQQQDVFYPFMDVFHTVKNIDRISLRTQDAEYAVRISTAWGIGISSALTCVVAIREAATQIHSWNPELVRGRVPIEMGLQGVRVCIPPPDQKELDYPEPSLENNYESALTTLQNLGIDLLQKLFDQKQD